MSGSPAIGVPRGGLEPIAGLLACGQPYRFSQMALYMARRGQASRSSRCS